MLSTIVLNEIRDHLLSLRFALTCAVMVLLMTAGAASFISEYHLQVEDYSRHRNEYLSQLSGLASKPDAIFNVFSWNYDLGVIRAGTEVYRAPNPLSFITEGHGRDLPNIFKPSAFRVHGPDKNIRSNVLLWRNELLDWVMILGVVISFTALILTYDRISGDRESGTLRLAMSNGVSRAAVIIGKFIGAFICLAVALLLGVMVHLAILLGFASIPFTATDWLIIGASFLVSLMYLSVFISFGLCISSLTRESATSLIISLLCWTLFVVVVPRTGGFIASRLTGIPSWEEALTNADEMEGTAIKEYRLRNPEARNAGMSTYWSPGEPLEPALVMSDGWSKVFDEYRNRMITQVDFARAATLLSPFSCYSYCLEELTETGFSQYRSFYRRMLDFKLALRRHLFDVYPVSKRWWDGDRGMSRDEKQKMKEKIRRPIDFASVPKFEEKRSGFGILLTNALPYGVLIIMFNVLFFAGTFVSFLKYDVR